MAQNLDRLGTIQQHLSLSPNSDIKFGVSLGRRLSEFDFWYKSPRTALCAFAYVDQDVATQDVEE